MNNHDIVRAHEARALQAVEFESLGLDRAVDGEAILSLAAKISSEDPATVAEFGRDVAKLTAEYSDGILDEVRNLDLDDAGSKLTEVLQAARRLNMDGLSDRRSRIPVIGPVIDRFRNKAADLKDRYQSTREQVDNLLGEVGETQERIRVQNRRLSQAFEAVMLEHRALGVHVAAGRIRVAQMAAEAESLRGEAGGDPVKLIRLQDLQAAASALDKRVGDLLAMQYAAMQALPMIRMIQGNGQMLVDKFATIREVTVPAWKRQFMIALTLNGHKNAVALANHIDGTTNDLMLKNADLLRHNSIETARANQRMAIDVSTLEKVQASLIQTVQDMKSIAAEGVVQRQQAVKRIEAMRDGMRSLSVGDRSSKVLAYEGVRNGD